MNIGGIAFPTALTAKHIVTSVPRSAEVIVPIYFLSLAVIELK